MKTYQRVGLWRKERVDGRLFLDAIDITGFGFHTRVILPFHNSGAGPLTGLPRSALYGINMAYNVAVSGGPLAMHHICQRCLL